MTKETQRVKRKTTSRKKADPSLTKGNETKAGGTWQLAKLRKVAESELAKQDPQSPRLRQVLERLSRRPKGSDPSPVMRDTGLEPGDYEGARAWMRGL